MAYLMPAPYGDWAERARDNGFFPVPMDGKTPMIRNWGGRPMGACAIRNTIAKQPAIAAANVGFRTGKLVAIDIDEEAEYQSRRLTDAAYRMLGYTPFLRIGRYPRRMLFYRSTNEVQSRKIGSVDILGAGKLAVVHGVHPDTGQWYYWPELSLLDATFDDVPLVSSAELQCFIDWLDTERGQRAPATKMHMLEDLTAVALETAGNRVAKTGRVSEGDRNNALFRHLKNIARKIPTFDKLLANARAKNREFFPPLPDAEVQSVAASVWKYRQEGRLFSAKRQSIVLHLDKAGMLGMASNTDAFFLAGLLKTTRSTKRFTIEQKATAKTLGWGSNRLKKAIDALIAAGGIRIVPQPGAPRFRAATLYEFGGFLLSC